MNWCLLAVLTVVLTGPPVLSQQIQLKVEGDTLTVVKSFPVTISGPAGADLYFWTVPPGVTFLDEGHSVKILAAPKGTLAVGLKIISVDWEAKKLSQKFGSVAIVIGELPPGPLPPIPPDPKPPVPPGPVTGLRVIFAWDKSASQKQIDILYSPKIASYLDAKCAGGPLGWRRYDKDTQFPSTATVFKSIWAAVQPSLTPGTTWLVIASDQKIEYFPLPATEDETLSLLKKFGG